MKYLIFILFIFLYSCIPANKKANEKLVLINDVYRGMSKAEVVRIMGFPDTAIYGIVDSLTPALVYYFYDDPILLSRKYVSVVLDSNNKVLFTSRSK